jgi:hypothetical protein
MKKLVFIILTLLIVTNISFAKDLMIYKDYKFGMDKSEALKMKGAYDCTEMVGDDAVCLPGQEYEGMTANIVLRFYYNKLMLVNLNFKYSEENFEKIYKSLEKDYMLAGIKGGIKGFDYYKMLKRFPKEFDAKKKQFIDRYTKKGKISYVFYDKASVQYLVKTADNIDYIIKNSPKNLKEADLIKVNDNVEHILILSFVYPKLATEFVEKESKKKKD